jgi:hypothetical protein
MMTRQARGKDPRRKEIVRACWQLREEALALHEAGEVPMYDHAEEGSMHPLPRGLALYGVVRLLLDQLELVDAFVRVVVLDDDGGPPLVVKLPSMPAPEVGAGPSEDAA